MFLAQELEPDEILNFEIGRIPNKNILSGKFLGKKLLSTADNVVYMVYIAHSP